MGNLFSKQVKKYKEIYTYEQIIELLNKSKVCQDYEMIFFIDCNITNFFIDGTSLHDIPTTYPEYSKHMITNPYLSILDIIKELRMIHNNNVFYLYFYGIHKLKFSKINLIYEDKKIKERENNIYYDFKDLINSYVAGIINLQNNKTRCSNNNSILFIMDEALKIVNETKKFTILINITNNDNYESNTELINKIFELSAQPIEIIFIALGNQHFETFKAIDEMNLAKLNVKSKNIKYVRKFDNFHLVIFNNFVKRNLLSKNLRNEIFKNMFSELPQLYNHIQNSNILDYKPKPAENKNISDTENIVKETKHEDCDCIFKEYNFTAQNRTSKRYSLNLESVKNRIFDTNKRRSLNY